MNTPDDQWEGSITFSDAANEMFNAAVEIRAALPTVGDRDPAGSTVLAVLISAAASVEGFLNEVGDSVVKYPEDAPWRSPEVSLFGAVWDMAEKTGAGVRQKYELAVRVLGGFDTDLGQNPHQNLALLTQVRNGSPTSRLVRVS